MVTRIAFAIFLSVLWVSGSYAKTPTIVVYGDSISAAYGMAPELGWVNLLSSQLIELAPQYEVINASVSGETTGGGLVRLPKTISIHQPDILILELGGNDGLRGYPIDKIESNLTEMVRIAQAAGARVMLIGMVLPPNYGKRYTRAFEQVFTKIAEANNLALVPFLLDGVATSESLLQRDGIHPRPEAQALLLENILPTLLTVLEENSTDDSATTSQ